VRHHLTRRFRALVLTILGSAVTASPAAADPLVIQSGSFGFSGGDPAAFRFIGEGFTLGAILFKGFPDFGPLRTCPYGFGCDPGVPLDFSASYQGPIVGWQTFDAPDALPRPDRFGVLYSIDIDVAGPTLTLPTASSALTRVTAPFAMTATLTANAITGSYEDYQLGAQLFSTTLVGHGTAELLLDSWRCTPTSDGGLSCAVAPPYLPAALSYDFAESAAPIPEPGTFALVALGVGVLRAAARRPPRPRVHDDI
jgi:hypothetical protein